MLTLAEPSSISTDIEQAGSSSQDAPLVVPTTEVEELRCRARRLTRDFLGNLERLELNVAEGISGAKGNASPLPVTEPPSRATSGKLMSRKPKTHLGSASAAARSLSMPKSRRLSAATVSTSNKRSPKGVRSRPLHPGTQYRFSVHA